MTIDEVRFSVADISEKIFPQELNLPDGGEVIKICCGFVAIDPSTSIVMFVHYSVREYLKTEASLRLEENPRTEA